MKFYRELFGWEFKKFEGPMPYWLVITGTEGPGIDGGLLPRRGEIDGDAVLAYICTVDVPALDEYVNKSVANGGPVCLPKMPIPGVGWLAYCKDTEGNIFGMMQSDVNAK